MPDRKTSIRILEEAGHAEAAAFVRGYANAQGNAGGWDGAFRRKYAHLELVLWPHGHAPDARELGRAHTVPAASLDASAASDMSMCRPSGTGGRFDAYLMVDWSANSGRKRGEDSIWLALHVPGGNGVRTFNCESRAQAAQRLLRLLREELASLRVLVGFDFPFGFPAGLAAALGGAEAAQPPWMQVWRDLAQRVQDDDENRNNRFQVAAAYNVHLTSGSRGPFYGRPESLEPAVQEAVPRRQVGVFSFPVGTLQGPALAKSRATDGRARVSSSPWFLYGGANSVGGQALVGIPRVLALREALPDARVWPFETGAALPSREEARVVLAEIYPSMFHQRALPDAGIHDELQVIAAARHFAALDARSMPGPCFEAPAGCESALQEEGWILGAR